MIWTSTVCRSLPHVSVSKCVFVLAWIIHLILISKWTVWLNHVIKWHHWVLTDECEIRSTSAYSWESLVHMWTCTYIFYAAVLFTLIITSTVMSLFHHCTFQSTGLYKLNVQHKRALQMRQKGTKLRRGTSSGWRQSFAKQQPRHLWSLLLLCPFAHVHPIKSYYSSRTCTHQAKSCSSEQTQTTAQTPEAPSCSFTFTLAVFYDDVYLQILTVNERKAASMYS